MGDTPALPPPQPVFHFLVEDSEGLWGGIRVSGEDQAAAEAEARRLLDTDELPPGGSLNPGYTLKPDTSEIPQTYLLVPR